MYTIDVLLLVVKEAGENGLQGRTLLQKKVYFLSELVGIDLGFSAHYYGPYSGLVAGNLASLVNHGFLDEVTEVFETTPPRNRFGEKNRYTYFLTDDAEELWSDIENDPEFPEWKEKLDRINDYKIAHDFDRLSIAAKVHYILDWRGESKIGEVERVAGEYGWAVSTDDIESVLSFLKGLGLVTTDESDDIPL
jgi:uncharacterized protein YwgA